MRATRLATLMLVVAALAAPNSTASLNRAFICFFDAGSAETSPRCRDVVSEFVAWWHRTQRGEDRRWPDRALMPARAMQVEVEDHADAAEAAADRASVSRTRAKAVAAFVRLNGVPADVIEVTAFGADRLLVPTSGAEPQNKRAQLTGR